MNHRLYSHFVGPDLDSMIYRNFCRNTPDIKDFIMNRWRGFMREVERLDKTLQLAFKVSEFSK